MNKIKILNLYAGIGGNRLGWSKYEDIIEVTAVEYKEEIAKIYKEHFPKDKIIVGDAHKYLLEHFEEFDFIWSSPPCPSHSRVRKHCAIKKRKDGTKYVQNKPIFPDMKLYEEILLLMGYFKGFWVIENVKSWYEPLIKPKEIGNHYYWSNFDIENIKSKSRLHDGEINDLSKRKGFDLNKYKGINKRLLLRNCVEPNEAEHIFKSIPFNNDDIKLNINKSLNDFTNN